LGFQEVSEVQDGGSVQMSADDLVKKAEALWKEICYLRDGRQCQVQKYYPEIRMAHESVLQVDHCISRGNKHFFFNPKNGTVVCRSCNRAKKYKQKSVDRAIDEIVQKREGIEWFNKAVEFDKTGTPNLGWGKIWWLEEIVESLERVLVEKKKVG
jgi:uncharacterized Zn finger protein (UPF0148 family)